MKSTYNFAISCPRNFNSKCVVVHIYKVISKDKVTNSIIKPTLAARRGIVTDELVVTLVVVNCCFTSHFSNDGHLSDIVKV